MLYENFNERTNFILCLPFLSVCHVADIFFHLYTGILRFPSSRFSLPLSVSWYNCDSYAQTLPASSVRNFRNCVVKQLTGILSSSCDESVNEISGNRRIGRSARPSPKGNVSRRDSALKTCRSSWHRESRERETTVSWSNRPCSLGRNAGITRRSRRRGIYSPKFRRDYYPRRSRF